MVIVGISSGSFLTLFILMYIIPAIIMNIIEYKNNKVHDRPSLPVSLFIIITHGGLNKAKNARQNTNNVSMIVNVFLTSEMSNIYYQLGNF